MPVSPVLYCSIAAARRHVEDFASAVKLVYDAHPYVSVREVVLIMTMLTSNFIHCFH